eukprot:GILI01016211.1.p1 GENE.GILI01016211.1~~GILI01016211.1.p1  ORF type:complete len:369 (-),score=73.65 GILI01016211.1:72-1178(-)
MARALFLAFIFAVVVLCLVATAEVTKHHPERLVVVGDIHGDLEQTRAILMLASVVDKKGNWIGGSHTKLVQMGDLVDRGEQDKEVLDYFIGLQKEASEVGGEVTMLIGNHEVMNMMGDVRYVHAKSMDGFGGHDAHKKAWSSEGIYGAWIRDSFKLVHSYNGTVFVHAGLAEKYAGYGVDRLNAAAKAALNKNDFDNPIFGGDGPVWTRLLINRAEYGRCEMVEASLKKLKMERMIVGHTPQRDQHVHSYCGGKLIAVDVGISKFMYGGLAAVEISQDPTTGETQLEEIVPNDIDKRSENELNKLEEKGGMDTDLLQEMLQTVSELEKENAAKKKRETSETAAAIAKALHREKNKKQKSHDDTKNEEL